MGLLAALPLTSARRSCWSALSHGPGLAASAAANSFPGLLVAAGFDLGYAVVALRGSWVAALSTGVGAYVLLGVAFHVVALPPVVGALVDVGRDRADGVVLADGGGTGTAPVVAPRWDLPARMVIAGSVTATVTEVAPMLGGQMTGLLSQLPILGVTMAVCTHRQCGPIAGCVVSARGRTGIALLRGVLRMLALTVRIRGRARFRGGVSVGAGCAGRVYLGRASRRAVRDQSSQPRTTSTAKTT